MPLREALRVEAEGREAILLEVVHEAVVALVRRRDALEPGEKRGVGLVQLLEDRELRRGVSRCGLRHVGCALTSASARPVPRSMPSSKLLMREVLFSGALSPGSERAARRLRGPTRRLLV